MVWSLSRVLLFRDPRDCRPAGSSVRGIFQARILEWVAISFFRLSSQPRDLTPCLLHQQADSLPLSRQGITKSPLSCVFSSRQNLQVLSVVLKVFISQMLAVKIVTSFSFSFKGFNEPLTVMYHLSVILVHTCLHLST